VKSRESKDDGQFAVSGESKFIEIWGGIFSIQSKYIYGVQKGHNGRGEHERCCKTFAFEGIGYVIEIELFFKRQLVSFVVEKLK